MSSQTEALECLDFQYVPEIQENTVDLPVNPEPVNNSLLANDPMEELLQDVSLVDALSALPNTCLSPTDPIKSTLVETSDISSSIKSVCPPVETADGPSVNFSGNGQNEGPSLVSILQSRDPEIEHILLEGNPLNPTPLDFSDEELDKTISSMTFGDLYNIPQCDTSKEVTFYESDDLDSITFGDICSLGDEDQVKPSITMLPDVRSESAHGSTSEKMKAATDQPKGSSIEAAVKLEPISVDYLEKHDPEDASDAMLMNVDLSTSSTSVKVEHISSTESCSDNQSCSQYSVCSSALQSHLSTSTSIYSADSLTQTSFSGTSVKDMSRCSIGTSPVCSSISSIRDTVIDTNSNIESNIVAQNLISTCPNTLSCTTSTLSSTTVFPSYDELTEPRQPSPGDIGEASTTLPLPSPLSNSDTTRNKNVSILLSLFRFH